VNSLCSSQAFWGRKPGDSNRHPWRNLRIAAGRSSVRLVTGGRRPLRDLCHDEESRASDFWEIFYDAPIEVGAFEEADWDDDRDQRESLLQELAWSCGSDETRSAATPPTDPASHAEAAVVRLLATYWV
jgi:hypothetical protein